MGQFYITDLILSCVGVANKLVGWFWVQHTVKKMKLIVLALVLLSVIITTATNYRKTYCNNNEYILRGDRYPHLHCGSNYFVLSRGQNDHKYFVNKKTGKALCKNVEEVLRNPSYYRNIDKITDVLQHFQRQECPNNNIDIESQSKDKESTNSPNKKSRNKREL